ncbi:hypothetical protein Q9189_002107 [Teloschistes chrysophthalmus]
MCDKREVHPTCPHRTHEKRCKRIKYSFILQSDPKKNASITKSQPVTPGDKNENENIQNTQDTRKNHSPPTLQRSNAIRRVPASRSRSGSSSYPSPPTPGPSRLHIRNITPPPERPTSIVPTPTGIFASTPSTLQTSVSRSTVPTSSTTSPTNTTVISSNIHGSRSGSDRPRTVYMLDGEIINDDREGSDSPKLELRWIDALRAPEAPGGFREVVDVIEERRSGRLTIMNACGDEGKASEDSQPPPRVKGQEAAKTWPGASGGGRQRNEEKEMEMVQVSPERKQSIDGARSRVINNRKVITNTTSINTTPSTNINGPPTHNNNTNNNNPPHSPPPPPVPHLATLYKPHPATLSAHLTLTSTPSTPLQHPHPAPPTPPTTPASHPGSSPPTIRTPRPQRPGSGNGTTASTTSTTTTTTTVLPDTTILPHRPEPYTDCRYPTAGPSDQGGQEQEKAQEQFFAPRRHMARRAPIPVSFVEREGEREGERERREREREVLDEKKVLERMVRGTGNGKGKGVPTRRNGYEAGGEMVRDRVRETDKDVERVKEMEGVKVKDEVIQVEGEKEGKRGKEGEEEKGEEMDWFWIDGDEGREGRGGGVLRYWRGPPLLI